MKVESSKGRYHLGRYKMYLVGLYALPKLEIAPLNIPGPCMPGVLAYMKWSTF